MDIVGKGVIHLLDLGGRPVFHGTLSGSGEMFLPAELPPGLYVLRVRSGGREFRLSLPIF